MTIRMHQKVAMQQHRLRHKLPTPRGLLAPMLPMAQP